MQISLQFDEFFLPKNFKSLISRKFEIFTKTSHLKLVETTCTYYHNLNRQINLMQIDLENPLWRNLRMARSEDPNWLEKSNFSVPPPPMYPSQDLDDNDEVVELREDEFDDDDDEEEEREPLQQPLVPHQHRPPNLELQIPPPSTLDCDQNCFYCLSCSAATPSLVASPAMPLTPQFVLPFRASLPNSPAPILVYSPVVATPVLPSTPLTPYIPQSLPSPFLSPLNVGDQQVFVYPSSPSQIPPQSYFPYN